MTIHAHTTLKLGRPAGPSTRDAVMLAEIVREDQLQAPPLVYVADAAMPETIGQYGNDRLGDCTCATYAAILRGDAAAKGVAVDFTDSEIVTMYRASGYTPGDSSTDNGWSMAAAAEYARGVGLRDTTGQLHVIGPWCQINWRNRGEVMLALMLFGSMPVGIALPLAYQDMSKPWDAVDGDRGEPGSWGGHSLTAVRADHDGVTLRTWGKRQVITWAGWMKYVDEAIAKIDPLWANETSRAPAGFDIDYLVAAQKVLR